MTHGLEQTFLHGRAMFPGLAYAAGLVTGVDALHINGYNAAVVAVEETAWREGGAYAYPAAATTLDVTSGSAEDDTDKGAGVPGTGAHTVRITGLDADYEEISEDIDLNGVGAVTTTAEFLRVNDMRVIAAGTGGANAGIILAKGHGGATVYAHIAAGANGTQQAVYTVPAGKQAHVIAAQFNDDSSNQVAETWRIMVREYGGVFIDTLKFITSNSYNLYQDFLPIAIPEKSDVEVRCLGTAVSSAISVLLEMLVCTTD